MFRISVIPPALAVVCLLALVDSANGQPTPAAPTWSVGKIAVQFSASQRDSLTLPSPLTWALPTEAYDQLVDIRVTDPSGSNLRKVADGFTPALSPDGRFVAFCGLTGGGQRDTQIMAIQIDGSGLIPLTNISGSPCAPSWSPDGRKIAFNAATNKGLAVMVLDLVQAKIFPVTLGALPRWSPDGKRLVFLRAPQSRNAPTSIWIINADGTGEKKVAETRTLIPSASWGADGVSIVFVNDDHHRSAIFCVNLDGANLEKIAGDKDMEMYFPSVSPDGKQLVVIEEISGAHFLALIDLSTHKARSLASGERSDVLWVKNH